MRYLKTFATLLFFLTAATTVRPADVPATNQPEDILNFLNQTVVWYRLLTSQQQLVNEPSDAMFLGDNRQIAGQVARLAFEFARTESQQLASSKADSRSAQTAPASPQYQNVVSAMEKSKQQISDEEKELASLKQQLSRASAKKRALLESAVAESEDELELLKTRYETQQTFLRFTSGMNTWTGTKGLQAQIDELARTVPEAATGDGKQAGAGVPSQISTSVATSADQKTESASLLGLVTEVVEFRRKLHLLDESLGLTDSLADASKALRSPLGSRMRDLTKRSDELASQPQSQDPDELAQEQSELKGMTAQYKQLSAAVLPLGEQNILLNLYKRNVSNWRNAVQTRYSQALKSLLLRLATLAGIIGAILGASYIWRRATFRYVQDSRRRHQFLILRRIIVIPLLLAVIVVAFASGLGSVTLFAGLSTAGLAVALQNLIQAVVGYFVLIGRFGVRVGDRIQVSGVTGEVIDIGLVRLHLVEMSTGPGSRPTGRVVAFSNSVVFQPDAGFFKQIPGTNFVWHDVSLSVSKESDYRQVEERMLQSVNRIFGDYKEKMELQRRSMERAIQGLSVEPFHPQGRLNLTPDGTQIVVRYPVEVKDAAEMDDRIARAVLDATGREPHVEASHDASASTVSEAASTGE